MADDFVLSAYPIGVCEYCFNSEDIRFTLHFDSGLFQSEDARQYVNVDLHTHTYYEWFYVTSGSMQVFTQKKSYQLCQGDFAIISPGVRHCVKFMQDATTRYNLGFSFSKNALRGAAPFYAQLTELLSGGDVICGSGNQELYEINKKISQLCGTNRREMICTCFLELLWSVLDSSPTRSSMLPAQELLQDETLDRSEKLRRVFSSYYMYNLSLEYVGAALGVSTRQLNRIIRKEYGCTYHERMSYMRICSAKQLLAKTDFTVGEIAQWVGYTSLSGFYMAFKNQCGCLPTEYRRLLRPDKEN